MQILHLTDLHFGYDKDETAKKQRAQALDGLVRVLAGLEAGWKPDVLAITGDLTWQGKPSGYTLLAEWLTKKLFPATGLTPEKCLVCPGNHDLDRDVAEGLQGYTGDAKRADEVLRPEKLAKNFARPFAEFVKFAAGFGIPAPQLNGADSYLVGDRKIDDVRFVCLNSAWFCRGDGDARKLWLGLPQLEAFPLMNVEDYDTEPVTVALVHHPLGSYDDHDETSYGRMAAWSYLGGRTHLILAGHVHGQEAKAQRLDHGAWHLVGGSSYMGNDYWNNFSLLRIDEEERGVERRVWEYDPRKRKWVEQEQRKYSFRAGKPCVTRRDLGPYMMELRRKTALIELNQLKVGEDDTPPPAIEKLYFPLKTAGGIGEAPGAGRGAARSGRRMSADAAEAMERAAPMDLQEALAHPRLVIEGKPGSGKTTFVRWMAWRICQRAAGTSGFPIWIRISELDAHIGDKAGGAEWIPRYLASRGWGLDEEFFLEKLSGADTLLMLDGLDEAPNATRRARMAELIREAAGRYKCRMVVTTRPGADEGRAALGGDFKKSVILELDDPGIDGFLLQWCRWLKREDEASARAYYDEIHPAVTISSIKPLARNPLMLTALAVLYLRRHTLPQQRAQLYEQIVEWLADQAVQKHKMGWPKEDIVARLGQLALAMQEWKGGMKVQIGLDDAAAALDPGRDLGPMKRFLEEAQIHSGIVTMRGAEIAFWHRSFQEFLAARTLANSPDEKLEAGAVRFLYSAEGREVLPLLAGYMAGPARERLNRVFERLTEDVAAQPTLERKAHAVGVLGNMLADLAPTTYALTAKAKAQYEALNETVMAIFKKGKTRGLPLKTRVDAAEALDQASRSRLRVPKNGDYWVKITGGTLTTGDPEAFQSLPAGTRRVESFRIGRYPVTVWEYGKYLEANPKQEKPQEWEEQEKHPGRPVVSVSWNDAQAYCRWAGCRLLTDHEWEFAARGEKGRIYAWGDEPPDEQRANFGMKVGHPSPVGMFPEGATPEGVADMTGNVWEWTQSDFEEGRKSVRGASFIIVDAEFLRAAARDGLVPGLWDFDLGFRCAGEVFP